MKYGEVTLEAFFIGAYVTILHTHHSCTSNNTEAIKYILMSTIHSTV